MKSSKSWSPLLLSISVTHSFTACFGSQKWSEGNRERTAAAERERDELAISPE